MAGQGGTPARASAIPVAPSGRSGWTTRRWLRTGVTAALVVLIGLGALGTWMLNRSAQVSDHLINHSSPALLNSVRLEAALVNQETGIRGYGLTGRRDFLQPYTQGLADEQTAVTSLRTETAGDGDAERQLAHVLAAAQAWQRLIATPVAAASSAQAVDLATARANTGLNAFNQVRDAAAVQQEHLQADRSASAADLRRVTDLTDSVFGAIAAIALLLVVLAFEGMRRGVTAPLGRLSADAAQVADGDFAHSIASTGPVDLRMLADVIEAMRRRMVEEIASADEARGQLDEQAADLRRSNAELEQFAYVASHDLQEPLRKVASFCQLLQRRYAGQLDERADQYIAFAVDGATRMQTLINDLLEFSRVGRLHAAHVSVDLEKILDSALDSLSLAVEESGAVVTRDPLPHVSGDPTQLGMLIQNLLSNALKFRDPDRPPRIAVEAERDGDWWRLAVSDNGIGIDPEYADRVFTIFQRLHTREAYPGNGIGLALCKKIVEFHGGTIDIDPSHTPGARLAFTLPAGAIPEGGSSSVNGGKSGDSGRGVASEMNHSEPVGHSARTGDDDHPDPAGTADNTGNTGNTVEAP